MAGMRQHLSDPLCTTPSARRVGCCVHGSIHVDRSCGVTLIELMIILAIIAVLLASAVPSFVRLLSNQRASSAVNDLVHGIALARAEALKRGRRVYIAPLAGQWRNGWAVFVDRNDNRAYDATSGPLGDELIFLHDALPASIVISNSSASQLEPFTDTGSPPRPYIMFDGSGYPRKRNGALSPGGLVVTDVTASGSVIRTLCLASSGRIRIVKDYAGCKNS